MLAEFLLPRIPVRIRVAEARDMPVLERAAGISSPGEAQAHLENQARGEGLYLIASIAGTPVGVANLTWAGVPMDRPYPEITRVSVFGGLQGYGLGTALLQSCEDACRERGYKRVGLVVDPVRESRGRVLYERLGYRFAEAGNRNEDGAPIDDSDGSSDENLSRSIGLVKDLS